MAVVFKLLPAAQENRRCHGNGKSPFMTLVTRETGRPANNTAPINPKDESVQLSCEQTKAKDQYVQIATLSSFTFSTSCVLDLRAILGEGKGWF